MPTSQLQQSQQMVAQLRLLNPNYSAEVGTPERLILDTAAQALTDSQIDLVGLENALNIDTKFGTNLDNFVGLFGFARQKATASHGFVIFSRNAGSTLPTTVPTGTIVQASSGKDGTFIQFSTTNSGSILPGELETDLIPVVALTPGEPSNVEAEKLTILSKDIPLGVTEVVNPAPTTGGSNQEDDNSLKVRFKNTVFRNLSGTKDQFLALAVATAFTTKANVVGPVSQYQEYVQVPKKIDRNAYSYGSEEESSTRSYTGKSFGTVTTGSTSGTSATLVVPSTAGMTGIGANEILVFEAGPDPVKLYEGSATITNATTITLGSAIAVTKGIVLVNPIEPAANEYTTTLSTIPYAKNVWKTKPVFITNDQRGIANYFFREGLDYRFNSPAKFQGDTIRAYIDGTGLNALTDRIGKTQPNVTFLNVYEGGNEAIQAITPEDVVLLEYSYTSTSSRNSLEHNLTNCVDVFVDGSNTVTTSAIFAVPPGVAGAAFVKQPNSMFYYENYRRAGEPNKRPLLGNILTPLFQEPMMSLPKEIKVLTGGNINNYYLGTHYWFVQDISEYEGTIRARDGIEWSSTVAGDASGKGPQPELSRHPPESTDPALKDPINYAGESPAGALFQNIPQGTAIEVENYTFDKNITDLQATLEASRQVTTDVLAHKARPRYFKLDLTIIYAPGSTVSEVNNNIRSVLNSFLASQYFGAAINLSDLLQEVHSVGGVQNVRWTADVPKTTNETRVYETDINGLPLLGASVDRLEAGSGSTKEVQELYVAGSPTGGGFTLTYFIGGTPKVVQIKTSELSAANLQTKIGAAVSGGVTVVEEPRETFEVDNPIKSYRITFNTAAAQPLPAVTNGIAGAEFLSGPEFTFNNDFFLRDNELPSLPSGQQFTDTLPGLILRPRAQGTWQRAN